MGVQDLGVYGSKEEFASRGRIVNICVFYESWNSESTTSASSDDKKNAFE
jgi:hypothetical protein